MPHKRWGDNSWMCWMWCLSLLGAALLGKAMLALGPHSGQGVPPMYGDFEAQRHWMEVTVHVPLGDWYRNTTDNDLQYWGLDYPPLSAYASWLCGKIVQWWGFPEVVALHESRGYELWPGKAFMRLSVLLCDLVLFLLPLHLLLWSFRTTAADVRIPWVLSLLILCAPPLALIDHGHFQYNCVSLGLTVLALWCARHGRWCLTAISFTLALNYKTMSLYHAPAFFFFLLGVCWQAGSKSSTKGIIIRCVSPLGSPPLIVLLRLLLFPEITCSRMAVVCCHVPAFLRDWGTFSREVTVPPSP